MVQSHRIEDSSLLLSSDRRPAQKDETRELAQTKKKEEAKIEIKKTDCVLVISKLCTECDEQVSNK